MSGTFEGALSWSRKASDWVSATVRVTSDGRVLADFDVLLENLQGCSVQIFYDEYRLCVNGVIHFQGTKETVVELIRVLSVWQSLGGAGFAAKWHPSLSVTEQGKIEGNQLLVCRFKVFAPVPPKSKHVKVARGPTVPLFPQNIQEDWFYVMGYLKSDGVLDLLHEGDGSLLYSIDVSQLLSSEVVRVDHSVFQNANTLYIGFIDKMRKRVIPNEHHFVASQSLVTKSCLLEEARVSRILIEFPLHIDLEDWFVTLRAFTKREYYYLQNSPGQKLRSSKRVELEVTEAALELESESSLYAEVWFWGAPWCRTAIVKSRTNPFWKELFKLECPCATSSARVIIKKCRADYSANDIVVGHVDIDLTQTKESNAKAELKAPSGSSVGTLSTTLVVDEYRILPHSAYKVFESMLHSLSTKDLEEMISSLEATGESTEALSNTLLDSFQALGIEANLFAALRSKALRPLDSMTRQNRVKPKTATSNSLNTLFRGNSILTKALEIYFLRVGREYLEKVVGAFVQKVSEENLDCEVDPRIAGDSVKKHVTALKGYVAQLWDKLFTTTNDLPKQIKEQLTLLRKDVENSVEPDDIKTPLNALSAFIFLRFICPALLNPKMFFLAKEHQTGRTQRTLMLVAKVLMTMANRSRFNEYKEPYMMSLDSFLEDHDQAVVDYFDKLTGRKLDFSERVLEMSDYVSRLSVEVPPAIVAELPTNPYLIEKYYALVQLAHSLNSLRVNTTKHSEPQILQIDDVDFGSQEFLSSLLESSNSDLYDTNISSFIRQNVTLQDVLEQAAIIETKSQRLCEAFEKPEAPEDFTSESWNSFTHAQLAQAVVDKSGHMGHLLERKRGCRSLEDVLKKLLLQTPPSFDSLSSTKTLAKPEKKANPLSRLFRRNKN